MQSQNTTTQTQVKPKKNVKYHKPVNYEFEYDETNSFPKYLYRGLDECVNTLTGDNLIFELCEKIRDLRKMSGDFIYD